MVIYRSLHLSTRIVRACKGVRELAEKTCVVFLVAMHDQRWCNKQAAWHDLTPLFQAIEDDLRSQYLWVSTWEGVRDGRKLGLP